MGINVTTIIERGWYRKSQTLNAGEWPKLYEAAKTWHTYQIVFEDDEPDVVIAKDDDTAMTAFKSLYRLDGNWYFEIREVITTYRPVAG